MQQMPDLISAITQKLEIDKSIIIGKPDELQQN